MIPFGFKPKILLSLLLAVTFSPHAEAKKLTVAVPGLNGITAFSAAQQKGYYREEGLEVEVILIRTALAVRGVIARDLDFTTAGGVVISPIIQGAPLHILFTSIYRPTFWLYARPGIREVKDLKGKKIGVSGPGGDPDNLVREILKRNGLDGDRDVLTLNTGDTPTRLGALLSGAVDAAMLTPPFTFAAEDAGCDELVNFTKQDWVVLQGNVVANDELLRSEPLSVEKFLRGTLKGFLFARNNRSLTVPILARSQKIKEDLAGRIYDAGRPAMTQDGTLSEELQRKAIELSLKRLGKPAPLLERVFNFSLVKKIQSELEAKGWKPAP
jgi:NitT/TauT family transport system substrate-binding protein